LVGQAIIVPAWGLRSAGKRYSAATADAENLEAIAIFVRGLLRVLLVVLLRICAERTLVLPKVGQNFDAHLALMEVKVEAAFSDMRANGLMRTRYQRK
jgi:hypothetical protein